MPETEFFKDHELRCKCCHANRMEPSFLELLEAIRREYGRPMQVTSAYRCPVHNAAVSSTGLSGPHVRGQAVDIRVRGRRSHELMKIALKHGMTGIGVNQKGGARFLHLDNLTGDNRPWVWSY